MQSHLGLADLSPERNVQCQKMVPSVLFGGHQGTLNAVVITMRRLPPCWVKADITFSFISVVVALVYIITTQNLNTFRWFSFISSQMPNKANIDVCNVLVTMTKYYSLRIFYSFKLEVL